MSWAEKRGRRYRGMYRDAAGKVRTAGWADGKKAARALAQAEELKIRHGDWTDPDAGRITFAEYFTEHWLPNRRLEDTTRAAYQSHYDTNLKDAFGDLQLRQITPALVQRWVVELERAGGHPKTIAKKFRTLATVLGSTRGVSAIRDGLIAKSPCERIELPIVDTVKRKRYEVNEVDQIMARMDEWWQAIVVIAADTGLRWGALQGLEARDYQDGALRSERTIVELAKAVTGNGTPFKVKPRPKDREPLDLPLSPEVATFVEQLIRRRALFGGDRLLGMCDRTGSALLRTAEWPNGRPVSRSYFRGLWRDAHGTLPLRTFHDLRGSHISWLIAGGADLGAVMNRSGHSQMSTVQRYFDELADADTRALDALARTRARSRGAR